MKILKIINNNVVSCIDSSGRETVVMGKGLGFASRPGMELCSDKAEKIFRLENQTETDRLKSLFASISEEQVELCNRIIAYASENLGRALSPSIYLTLMDHISFALTRIQQGILFQSAVLAEVRTFYPREFAVGKYATALIEKKLGVSFPEDEAASIALHIVNAELDTSLSETMHMTQSLHEILEILRQSPSVDLQEDSPYFDEFTVHLKFLVMRAFAGLAAPRPEPDFVAAIRQLNPREYDCAALLAEYLEKECMHPVSDEDKAYLAVQIHRINTGKSKKEGIV